MQHRVGCPRHGERLIDLDGPEPMCPDCRVLDDEGRPLGWQDGRPTEYVDLDAMYRTRTPWSDRLVAECQRLAADDPLPRLEDFASGELVSLDPAGVAAAARALAVWEGDGRLYDEDEEAREGFAACVRIVVGVYLGCAGCRT